ncbi:MAG TPA: aldehyde dehydrogenase [Clostridiales bacterium]|nr:aldehyde dehydrogenase [Clostridiales bacterium]
MTGIKELCEKQRRLFESEITRNMAFRKACLQKLKKEIAENEADIMEALKKDLNKSAFETYATEIGMVLEEINFMLKNMKRLLSARQVRTPVTQFPASSRIYQEPYGTILIMSPWNYPFQLAMVPLVGAIACGNCAIIKPSNYSPETSKVIRKVVSKVFDASHVAVIEGGREVNQSLLDNKFDLIFFTGSIEVGKIVMEKAAKHLTPVVLELGGKSPCIVDKTADIRMAGKRIAWGKCLNAGQTCVAPDYLLVHRAVKEELTREIIKNVKKMYTGHPEKNPEFPKIINRKHFERLNDLIGTGKVIYGGGSNGDTNQIAFTLMDWVSWEDPVMQEEIFGPVLPMIEYENIEEVIHRINRRPKPLALYLFTRSKAIQHRVVHSIAYGGGCINDTIVHLATSYMAFGGVGESGMGAYHGKESIRTFSHSKSVLKKSNLIDIPVRYAPYGGKLGLLKKIMK